jgi:hypothetical protein
MNVRPEQMNDTSRRRPYLKPDGKNISLKDEAALLNFCKQKPFDVKDLREMIHEMLKDCRP